MRFKPSPMPSDEGEQFPRLPWRRRLLILLLAVVTAAAVIASLVKRPAGADRRPPAPCAPGHSTDCVGGKADVIVVRPAAAPASR